LSGYDVFDDPYCYKGTSVLKNRARLRDAKILEAFELEMSTLRSEEPLPAGHFTPAHYRRIHHHLFQDVYPWAGKYRTVRTSKGGNMFGCPEHIASSMDKLFKKLALAGFKPDASAADFLDASTDFLAELNAIHPFREGNGRSQLSLMYLLGQRAGHPLDLTRIDRNTFMPAMIASFLGDNGPLKNELQNGTGQPGPRRRIRNPMVLSNSRIRSHVGSSSSTTWTMASDTTRLPLRWMGCMIDKTSSGRTKTETLQPAHLTDVRNARQAADR
jgi:cell filamentation protein